MSARLSISAAAEDRPDAVGLIAGDRALTFAELADLAGRRAARFVPGACVSRVAGPDLETAVDLYAALDAGRPFAPLHPAWVADEVTEARERLQGEIDDGDALVLFTSGSQGRPRAAVFTRAALAASAEAVCRATAFGIGDRWLCALPTAHIGGLAILLRCLHARATAVVLPFETAAVAGALAAHRVSHVSLVPTLLERLLADPRFPPSTLRCALIGGAPLDDALATRCIERAVPIVRSYGMTETGSMIAADGAPLDGVELAVDDSGRLRVRSATLLRRYLDGGGPDERGWLSTGDRAVLTGGHLRVLGRADDLIISGGENVDPTEVELALRSLPGVDDAFVCGVPDPRWGQAVVAAVVADQPPDPSALEDRLAPYKRPRRTLCVASLPRTASGKVDRRRARQLLGDLLATTR